MTIEKKIEIMQHFADGGEVEMETERNIWISAKHPTWNWLENTYRIKPEPKRETVTLHGEESYSGFWGFDSGSEDPSEYRITFDLVDGEPDCASINMEEV